MALTNEGCSRYQQPIVRTFFCRLCEIYLENEESMKSHIQKHEYMNLERRVCCTNLTDVPWNMLCLMEMFNPMDDLSSRSGGVSYFDVFMVSKVLKDFLTLAQGNQFQYLWKEEAQNKFEELKVIAKMVNDNARNRLRADLEKCLNLPSVIVGEVLDHLLRDAIYEHGKEGFKLVKFEETKNSNKLKIMKDCFRFLAKAFDKIRNTVGDACGRCQSRKTFNDIWIPDLDDYDEDDLWIRFFNNHNSPDDARELSVEATSNIEEQQNLVEMTPELWEIRLFGGILEVSQEDDDDNAEGGVFEGILEVSQEEDDDDDAEGRFHLQFFDAPMEISMEEDEEENELVLQPSLDISMVEAEEYYDAESEPSIDEV